MFIRSLLPVSYLLYGLVVSLILTIAGISRDTSVVILIIAYCINIPMTLLNKSSIVERIFKYLAAPHVRSIFLLDNSSENIPSKSLPDKTETSAVELRGIEQAMSFRQILDICKAFEQHFKLNIKVQ